MRTTTLTSTFFRAAVLVGLLSTVQGTSFAQPPGSSRVDGEIAGAPYTLVKPDAWNGSLVLLVHGSIPGEFEALTIGLAASGFGVAFATLPAGLGDGAALKTITTRSRSTLGQFAEHFGEPQRTYLVGFSRGAHNMAKLLETSPGRFDGMLSICGGNGGSQLQWDYFFTARVLFDHYFPGVLPGSALDVPAMSLDEYFANVAPAVINAILSDPLAALAMGSVDQYPLAWNDFGELASGILQSLAIHSVSVNDLLASAHGNPFDNVDTAYSGTSDDAALNAGIARLAADRHARKYLENWYQPSGTIGGTSTLLLHTSRDPFVPERANNDAYESVVTAAGEGDSLVRRVVDRFGHCTFSPGEIAGNLVDLVLWAELGIKPSP